MSGIRFLLAMLVASAWAALAQAGTELVMIEEDGCIYCARFNREISEIYPKTAEGKIAPLRRLDIHEPLPDGYAFTSRAVFTPTFVLVVDGQEKGRIEGYPGDEFFWFLLTELLRGAGIDPALAATNG